MDNNQELLNENQKKLVNDMLLYISFQNEFKLKCSQSLIKQTFHAINDLITVEINHYKTQLGIITSLDSAEEYL